MRSITASSFWYPCLLLAITSFLVNCGTISNSNITTTDPATSTLPSLKDKNVLLVYGGWPGHKPKLFAEIAQSLLEAEGANVTLSDTVEIYTDSLLLASMDLIVQSITMDKINKRQMGGLAKAIKNGVGFAGAHGGFCDAFRNNTLYQYLTGGQFVAHPGGQIPYRVHIKNKQDAITRDMKDFDIKTEKYYVHIDPNVKVLATASFTGEHDYWIDGATMPVAWKKYHGKGRIYCLTLGHNPEEFHEQSAQTLLMNGFRWASGSKYEGIEEWVEAVY